MAGRLEGRWIAFLADLTRAGANWSDEPLVIDGNVISSRKPDDLPVFCDALVEQVASSGQTADL